MSFATLAPQQAQPQIPQGSQSLAVSQTEDPLFTALRQYITTGSNATHITTKQLNELYQTSISTPASRSNLEATLTSESFPVSEWAEVIPMNGTVDIIKKEFSFELTSPKIKTSVKGSAFGVLIPFSGPINGQLWYHKLDDLAGGPGSFHVTVFGNQIQIDFRRNGNQIVASFNGQITFPLTSGLDGSCDWA